MDLVLGTFDQSAVSTCNKCDSRAYLIVGELCE